MSTACPPQLFVCPRRAKTPLMFNTSILAVGLSLAAAGVEPLPAASAFSSLAHPGQFDTFNYVLGTQTFSPTYQFTKNSKLVETAEAILEMGSTVIKFELSERYARPNGNVLAKDPKITSLAELARHEPSHRRVLDMPFARFVLWAHAFRTDGWRRGLTKEQLEQEYREMYDLTAHLLKTYSGSGKTFYLGHWEGDGWLRGGVDRKYDARVTQEAVQGMGDWLNTRQRAVDDAKRDIHHEAVQVWHYTEVNHVRLAMDGRPALVNTVLPKTTVDLVSYSSYDTQTDPVKFKAALTFIESKLPPKPAISGRRVFVGEYGFPARDYTPARQESMSRRLIVAALEWGSPLVLYWECYNNEIEDGRQLGFWMIDDKNAKQPVYETHRQYYQWAGKYRATTKAKTGHEPTEDDFRREAVLFLKRQPSGNGKSVSDGADPDDERNPSGPAGTAGRTALQGGVSSGLIDL